MQPNFNHSPRSAHPIPSRPNTQFSNGLQLRDIKELPIIYPSPSPKSAYETRLAEQEKILDDKYDAEDGDDDDDDDWELEHEYIDVGTEEAAGYGIDPYLGAPTRPRQIRRESQDVEFGHRTPPSRRMRGRGRGWEVNVRIPRMKGLARGKTVILKSIRGGLRRTHTTGHSPANGSPPFEFRDPQPAPQSIRQQYLELAPSDGAAAVVQEMRTENGLLAPPLEMGGSSSSTTDARESIKTPEADAASRHSRSQSMFSHSQSQARSSSRQTLRAPSLHSHSRSEDSHHSAVSNTQEGTTVVQHSYEDGTAESTAVRHVNDIGLIPIFPPSIRSSHVSKSSKSSKSSKVAPRPRRSNTITTVDEVRIPNPLAIARSARSHHSASKSKGSTAVIRALQTFNRLPWVANPKVAPGAFIPEEDPARVTKDFIPTRSARAKLRERRTARGTVYAKKGVNEVGGEEAAQSWYQPNARQLQRAMRTQHQQQTHALAASAAKLNIAKGGAVQQAYASYRAANGRPLGYMYASPSRNGSNTGGSVYSAAQQYGGHSRSGGSAAYGRTGASISAAASAYLTRSASASQASSPSALRSGYAVIEKTKGPPPVPTKSGLPPTLSQQQPAYPTTYPAPSSSGHAPVQPVQYYTYNFAYPQNQPYAYTQQHVPGSSPPLPPLPPASYSLSYAPTASSTTSVPTIPTIVSSNATATPAISSNTHSYPNSQAHSRSASSSSGSATSGYGTVRVQGPVRYVDYAYSYQPTR